jgi:hypothetical protein
MTGAIRRAAFAALVVATPALAEPGYDTGPFVEPTALGELAPGESTRRDAQRALGAPDGVGRARWPGDPVERELWVYEDFDVELPAWNRDRVRERWQRQRVTLFFRDGVFDGYLWARSEGAARRD